jgi:hypothetical protein
MSRETVVLAGLELGQQLLHGLLHLREFLDKRVAVHYRVISRLSLIGRRASCRKFLIDSNDGACQKNCLFCETETPGDHWCE